jgi:hypothetical protein
MEGDRFRLRLGPDTAIKTKKTARGTSPRAAFFIGRAFRVRLRHRLRLLLDLLHVLLEEPLLDVHHVELTPLDVRLIDVRRHIERRARLDQQRTLLRDLERAHLVRDAHHLRGIDRHRLECLFLRQPERHRYPHPMASGPALESLLFPMLGALAFAIGGPRQCCDQTYR